jgi:hypothetical protein
LWWSVAACSLLLLGIWFVVPNSTSSSDSLLAENEFIYVVDYLSNYLAFHVPSTVIEEELFDLGVDFMLFGGELTGDEILAYLDFACLDFSFYDLAYLAY